jgi:hypothetical protein
MFEMPHLAIAPSPACANAQSTHHVSRIAPAKRTCSPSACTVAIRIAASATYPTHLLALCNSFRGAAKYKGAYDERSTDGH